MFKRLVLEDWQNYVPYVSFGVIFLLFLVGVIYALRMKKDKVEHLANLPIESQDKSKHTH